MEPAQRPANTACNSPLDRETSNAFVTGDCRLSHSRLPNSTTLWGDGMKNAPHSLPTAGAFGEQLTFIDPPPICPAWPGRNSLASRALTMFLDGRVFGHLDFLERCRSWRLAAVVFRLRKLGWPIDTIKVSVPSVEHSGRTIAHYRLPAEYVAQAMATMTGRLR